jgi:hypothetical protein
VAVSTSDVYCSVGSSCSSHLLFFVEEVNVAVVFKAFCGREWENARFKIGEREREMLWKGSWGERSGGVRGLGGGRVGISIGRESGLRLCRASERVGVCGG